MKALFQRFRKDKDRDSVQDRDLTPTPKEKFIQLPPLPQWPPPERATSTPTSSFKPLPELSIRPLPTLESSSLLPFSADPLPLTTPSRTIPPLPPPTDIVPEPVTRSTSSRTELDPSPRTTRKTTNGSVSTVTATTDTHKKVAFISPPPTPANLDRTLPDAPGNGLPPGAPMKTTLSRFQAAHGREPRGSTSTAASASSNDITSSTKTSVKATSTRTTTLSPLPQKGNEDNVSIDQSLRSGTPYSQMSNKSSRILAAASWSETAEDDLVSNLGARERTRQEVLFEILVSEERYVAELAKMKDTFIDPLLHPFATSPVSIPRMLESDDFPRLDSPMESAEYLPPIAARFMSPSPFRSDSPATISTPLARKGDSYKDTPNMDGESMETDEDDEGDDHLGKSYSSSKNTTAKHNHPRSPYRSTATRTSEKTSVPFPSRSHQSLPPPPRTNPMNSSTQSLGRQSAERERNHSQGHTPVPAMPGSRVLRKFRKSQTTSDNVFGSVAPHQLPEDLRICLEVVDRGVLDGHRALSEALRRRYEEQYPLVRSLADVFVSSSDIFHGYATYVLHLERALEQVDEALSKVDNKKPKKQDGAEWAKICRLLQKLEEVASDKGETGLAITLSKPFQRLLKYPLLFQNLLFHTDPSTFEYESTLQMVAEVETIVRSIEDEKIQKEERDKTRDVFARIEGLEKVKQLALPKPSRVLVEERPYMPGPTTGSAFVKGAGSSPPVSGTKVKGKSSFKRLSDVLHAGNMGGKKDLWLVVFNDVVLQCQRTGTTSLPLVAATNSRTNSLPDLQGKTKYATTGRRTAHTKPRNLYKFLKIETWAIGGVVQPREGVVSMEEVVRSRAQVHSSGQPKVVPLPNEDEDDDGDSDDSDRKSKMSFSYWGADKITVQKPLVDKPRIVPGTRRPPTTTPSSYARESSANAKFGNRLMSADNTSPTARAASRRVQGTPAPRRPTTSDDGHSAKATVTRPAWDASTRTPVSSATPAPSSRRTRNTSQTSAATRVATTTKSLSSPAPSEDSGVGLYRQMLAQNPSLTRV